MEEAELGRLAARLAAGLVSAQLHVRAGRVEGAPPVSLSELAAAGAALERGAACLLMADEPDARIASRVARLAAALLDGEPPGSPAAVSVFAGLCAYGALAPLHDAGGLVTFFLGPTAHGQDWRVALPAVIALSNAPAARRLLLRAAETATQAAVAGDRDAAELGASAVLAVVEAHGLPPEDAHVVENAKAATVTARLELAEEELAKALGVGRLPLRL